MAQILASPERSAELLELIGDPSEVASDLAKFHEAALALSSNHPRFIDDYPQKWVAVCGARVLAADNLDDLLEEVDEQALPRETTVVRFIEQSSRVLTL